MTSQQHLSSRSCRGNRSPSRVQKLAALANLSPAAATALHRLPALPTPREPTFGTVPTVGRTPGGGQGGMQPNKRASRHSCCSEENVHALGSASRLSRCSTWCMNTGASPDPTQLQRSFSQQVATRGPDAGHPIQAESAPLVHLLQPGHQHQEICHPHNSRACLGPSGNPNYRQNHRRFNIWSSAHSSCSASESGQSTAAEAARRLLAALTERASRVAAAAPPATAAAPSSAAAGQDAAPRSVSVHDHLEERAPVRVPTCASAASTQGRLLLRSKSSVAEYVFHMRAYGAQVLTHSGSSGSAARLRLQASTPRRRTSQPALAVGLDDSPVHALHSSPAVLMATQPTMPADPECTLGRWPAGSSSSAAGFGNGTLHAAISCTMMDSLPGSTCSNADLSCVDGVSDAAMSMLDPGQAPADASAVLAWDRASNRASSSAVRLSQQRGWSGVIESGQGDTCSCKQDAGMSGSTSLIQTSERHSRPAQAGASVDTLRSSRRRRSSTWMTGELGGLSAWEPGQLSSSQMEDLNSAASSVLPPQPHGPGVPQQPRGAAAAQAAGAARPGCVNSASARTSGAATAAASAEKERTSPVTTERSSSCQLCASKQPPYLASSCPDDAEYDRRASDDSACGFGLLMRLCRRITAKQQDS